MNLTSVLGWLPSLKDEELRRIIAEAQRLLNGKTPTVHISDYLLDGIHHELQKRGIIGYRLRMPEEWLPSGFSKVSLATRECLERALLKKPSEPEKLALGRFAAVCLLGYMTDHNIELRPRAVLCQIGNVLAAIDHAYPKYLQSGLLSFCLEHHNA